MAAPTVLTPAELAAINDPGALLDRAWALEPPMRLSERRDALERLQQLLDAEGEVRAPPGRDWHLELLAERAIEAAANFRLEEATDLSDRVLRDADPLHQVAAARALLARGRILAWTGTEEATRQADLVLIEAAKCCEALGNQEWHGFVVFWRGYAVYYQNGDLPRAVALIGEALEISGPDSPRRSTVLGFYADALGDLGDRDAAERVLTEAAELADRVGDRKSRDYVAWSRARIASASGDAFRTERLLREVERDAADWFESHIGAAFLADAAVMLDRVGLSSEANRCLERAVERSSIDDESILRARATVTARSGDPWSGLDALQEIVRGDWLEKRLVWHHTLLTSWATFRAGRDGAGERAALAFDQAVACGGVQVANATEPELVAALAPLAERAGSAHARGLLLAGRTLVVRLFGTPTIAYADGDPIELPAGKPGELVRLLAIHRHGLPVDVVLEAFFPDAPPAAGRQRLRQVLTRLRAAVGDVVARDGDTLRLAPAWVDVLEFMTAADRVRSARGQMSVRLAYGALACWGEPLLPADSYASWAEAIRGQVEYRYLALLDLIAADARARGSHQEALTALEAAVAEDPQDGKRYAEIAEQLIALGRHEAARYLAERAGVALDASTDSEPPAAHFRDFLGS